MQVGVVGAGSVGSACVLSLVLRGVAHEIVLVNRNRKRADSVVRDIQYGAVLSSKAYIRAGDYADLTGASLVILTAGLNEKNGGATDRSDPVGRLRLLQANATVYQEIVPQVHHAAPNAQLLVATDPPDPLVDIVRMLGHERVLSTGTYLDSLRFRFHLAQRLRVNPASVEALVVGEHGTSAAYLWSLANVGGRPVLELLAGTNEKRDGIRQEIEQQVRYANISIIEGIGASQYGIGIVCARIAEMILRDERAVIPIGSYNPKYGVTLSLPSIVGREGVMLRIEPDMSDSERGGLERSAAAIKQSLVECAHLMQRVPKAV